MNSPSNSITVTKLARRRLAGRLPERPAGQLPYFRLLSAIVGKPVEELTARPIARPTTSRPG